MSVTIFCDLPVEGWRSMDLYAERLVAALRAAGCSVSPYAPPSPALGGSARVLTTYLWRMLVYPLCAPRRQGTVNHVIDHSYGHLVYSLDARRTVVTCHDLAPLVFPDRAARGLSRPLWRHAFRGTQRAAHVIADSESTRRDLLRHSPDLAGRVSVVYPGVDHATFSPRSEAEQRAVRLAYGLPDGPVVLHVGRCGYRKNLETLLRSFALLRQRGTQAILVQAGGRFSNAQHMLIGQLGIDPWICQVPFIAAEDLPALYSLAEVFVFPSWYEGFGLPVLEAMACGTPVVAAEVSAVAEVVGDAGRLVNPNSAELFAEAILELLSDADLAQDRRRRGSEGARRFTWQRTAEETMQVYHELAGR